MTTILPDGTVTVVFTDVEGSTALRSALGDDRASALLEAHAGTVRGLLGEHDGTEVKALGDGFMLVFTSTRRALEFAVAVHRAFEQQHLGPADRPLRVRIGMHTGEVVARAGDLFGQAVHAAARVQDVARGGETLASDLVRALAGSVDGIAWEDRGEHDLKGFDTPWTLHALTTAHPPEPDRRPPLVGRTHERARLLDHLDDLADGRGSIVLVEGEAGVGKSRLAEELQAEATARGHRVLASQCSERLLAAPFGPWVDLLRAGVHDTDPDTLRTALGDAAGEIARVLPELRRMFPDIPEPMQLPADQERHFVLLSVIEFLARAAAQRPLVLVVDDLQWADESTLALVEHASPHMGSHPVLVLGTYRPTDDRVSTLAADLATHGRADHLRLQPLGRDAVSDLLAAQGGSQPPAPVVSGILDRTGGNPFYVEELFAHLVETGTVLDDAGTWVAGADLATAGLPDSIRLVLQARLGRLDPGVLPVLAAAATLGRSSPLELVGRVAGDPPGELVEGLDAAERAGLLRTAPDPAGHTVVTFTHDLIRDAVLDDLTHVRRQQLHRRAAEALLDTVGDDRTRAAAIADHLLAAGDLADPAVTARALVRTGEAALDAAAFADAQQAFERVVASAAGGGRVLADAHRGLGYALRSTQGWEASVPHLLEAMDTYEAAGDAAAIGELCVEMSIELAWAFEVVEAFRIVDRGLAALAALGEVRSTDALQLAAGRSALLGLVGDTAGALATVEEIGDWDEQVEDPEARARILHTVGRTWVQLVHVDAALDCFADAAGILRAGGDLWQLAETLGWRGVMLGSAGRVDEAADVRSELAGLSDRLEQPNGRLLSLRGQRFLDELGGRLDEVEAVLAEDQRLCREHGMPWGAQTLAMQGHLAALRGDAGRADDLSAEAVAGEVVGGWAGPTVGMRATVLSLRGDADGLEDLLAAHPELCAPDAALTIGRSGVHPSVALACARVGDHDGAAARLEVLRRLRDERGVVVDLFGLVPMDVAVAVSAWCAGEADEARTRVAAARRFAGRQDLPLVRGEVDGWEAWLLRRAGDDAGRADALAAEAVAAHRRAGAHGLADSVEGGLSPGRP